MTLPSVKATEAGPSPRLHQAGVVFVKGTLFCRHLIVILPCLGHHHHDRLLQRSTAHQQEFQHIVERARVATVGLNDRKQFREVLAKKIALDDTFASAHPVDVAASAC